MKRHLLIVAALLLALPAAAQTPVASRAGMWYSRGAYTVGAGIYSCSADELCLGLPPLTAGGTNNGTWLGGRLVRVNAGGTALESSELSLAAPGVMTWPGSTSGSTTLTATAAATGALTLPASTGQLVPGPTTSTDNEVMRFDSAFGKAQGGTGALFLDNGAADFPDTEADKLRLHGVNHGIGVENATVTSWADSRFRWRLDNAGCVSGDTCRTAGDAIASLSATGLLVGGTGDAAAPLHVLQPSVASVVMQLQSTATNDDVITKTYHVRGATTNATPAVLFLHVMPASTVAMIEARVYAHCTGGASCTAENGAGYFFRGAFKNNGGTSTLIGTLYAETNESVAGWDSSLIVFPATSWVYIPITGAATTNITWHAEVTVREVGT